MSRKIKIGNIMLENDLILAPMAGITNLPFRLIAKKFGAGLVTTEMISAEGLCQNQKKTYEYLRHTPEEGLLCAQIFGSEPEVVANAAQIAIESGASIIDINMGCPVKKVVKTGAGGALLKNLKQAERIMKTVKKTCNVPITIKIRAGWSSNIKTALEISRIAKECGIDAITIHPRFVTQGFSGKANWSIISEIKEKLDITVIGNGDIFDAEDAINMIKKTGCDAVMIARGAIGNPWIFRDILDLKKGNIPKTPSLSERKEIMLKHFYLIKEFIGEKRAIRYIRGIFIWYSKNLPYSSYFRDKVTKIRNEDELMMLLNKYFLYLKKLK